MTETPQTKADSSTVPPQTRGEERSGRVSAPPPQQARGASDPTAWVGWVVFAAVMMMLIGTFHAIAGLTALFDSGYYVVGEDGLVVSVDYAAWGWTHVVMGGIAIAAAFGLLAGQTWARVIGIAMAVVSAVLNMAFMPAYPLWSIIVITLDVLVIYAIAVHGGELRTEGA